jgi:hypothetical protein
VYPDEYAKTEPRVIIVQQNPVPQMPTPVMERHIEWRKDANVPPELVQYLGLLLSNGEGSRK